MTVKKKETNLPQLMLEGATLIYLVLMIGVFPFVFHNKLYDITWAKKNFFQMTTIVLLVCALLFGIPACIQFFRGKSKEAMKETFSVKKSISVTDLFTVAFLLVVVISCILSPVGSEAFWGTDGRQLGGAFLLLCVGVYFVVSRCYRTNGILLWVFLIGNSLMYLLLASNFWGLDPTGMLSEIGDQRLTFMGLLGNINVNSAYCGVMTAVTMGLYYLCEEKLSRICYWCASVLGVYACYCTRSESWMLSVGGGMLLLMGFAMRDKRLDKWWRIAASFFVALLAMKLTDLWGLSHEGGTIFMQFLRGDLLLYGFLRWRVLLVLAVGLLLLFVLLQNKHLKEGAFWDVVAKWGPRVLLVLVLAASAVALRMIFPLEDTFGSSRGIIWKWTVGNFKKVPLLYQLFGYGPNCFYQYMQVGYQQELASWSSRLIDAHNEFLQFLAVTGMFGAVSYFGMQAASFVTCLRRRGWDSMLVLGCVGILTFALQGLVNNPLVFTTPLYFIFLGMMESKQRQANLRQRLGEQKEK